MTLAEDARVIFVGGTPFSGAEAAVSLLGRLDGVAAVPIAARFHSDPSGIPGLLAGRLGLADFVAELRAGPVARAVPRPALEAAIAELCDSYDADPLEACRRLFRGLMDRITGGRARLALVESSPGNLIEAQALARLEPHASFVHVVRDGRDVAAAAGHARVAPDRLMAGLIWWGLRLRQAERGIRGEEDGAPYAIPEDQLAITVLDELASEEGEAAYLKLLDRLSLTGGPSGAPLDPEAIGRGRWRRYARGPGAWRLSRRYGRILRELRDEGNHAAPPLLAALERLG